MLIQIKHRYTGEVIFEHDCQNNSFKLTVELAVSKRVSLAGASLTGANLDGANLYGANLDGANLDGETLTRPPVQVLTNIWPVMITPQYMRIGCQRYTHTEWESFDDYAIANMHDKAIDFWKEWRDILLAICKKESA